MFDKLFNDHLLFAMQKNKNIQLHWDPRVSVLPRPIPRQKIPIALISGKPKNPS